MTDRPTISQTPGDLFCGMDLHGRKIVLHVCDRQRVQLLATTVPADVGRVAYALERFRPHVVVGLEASARADEWADALEELGIRCRIGHPGQIRAWARGRRKIDPHDAEWIARLLVSDLFPDVFRVPLAVRRLRELLRRRRGFVQDRAGGRTRTTQTRPRRRGRQAPPPPGPGDPDGGPIADCDAVVDAALTEAVDRLGRRRSAPPHACSRTSSTG